MRTHTVKRYVLWIAMGLSAAVVLLLLGVFLLLRGSLARLDGIQHAPALTAGVTVTRDARGVPVISGVNRVDIAYATGFIQAQERFFQMDLMRRAAAGELAELFGPRALNLDKAHRLHRFRARAEQAVRNMAPAERQLLQRYVDGINDGLDDLRVRPFEYGLVQTAPRHWVAADSLLVLWAMYFDLQGNLEPRELARGWLKEHSSAGQLAFLLPPSSSWDAPLDADAIDSPAAPIPATAPSWWGRAADAGARKLAAIDHLDFVGSNNWALAGSRSASGAAIIADDMHLGLRLPNTWYRVVLQFPDAHGSRRMVGLMLPGAPPFIAVGSNGHVAWGFTNSYGDYLDLIAAEQAPERPGQVRLGHADWETPAAYQERIAVRGQPDVVLTVRESSLGPLREAGGRTYAVHWVAHAPQAINFNAARMEAADTLDAALGVAASMGLPAQNFVAGDDRGNIGWTIAGPLPRRVQHDNTATFPLDAANSAAGWNGWLTPDQYPRVRNPASGQLATANSRQLNGADAALIGDGGFDLGARTRQVRDDLSALGKGIDERHAYGVGLDDRAVFLSPWRQRLLTVLQAPGAADTPARREFLRLLQTTWSGRASADAVAYRLTRGFLYALYDQLYGGADLALRQLDGGASMAGASARWPQVLARLLDEHPAGWLPARFPDWQALQLATIDMVIADLSKNGKPLAAATWGQRNTAAIAHPIAASLPSWLRDWLSAPHDMLAGDNNMPRVAGPAFGQSERLAVSPGREELGIFNMPGGQSGHPLSPFFLAGHDDWVNGRTVPLLPGAARYSLTFVK